MSQQIRLFLLPSDIDALLDLLKQRATIRILQDSSPSCEPVELSSPVQKGSIKFGNRKATSVHCFLTPNEGVHLDISAYPEQGRWVIQPYSEAIEFSGCDFDGATLIEGRLYFQQDQLIDGAIFPKSAEFTKWANGLFRSVRKSLRRDIGLYAYVGKDADLFRTQGGRFASSIKHNGEPCFL